MVWYFPQMHSKPLFHSSWLFSLAVYRSLCFTYPFPKQAPVFTCLQYKSFENTVGKGEIARNEQFLLFPQCFLSFLRIFCYFHQIWNCRLQTFNLDRSTNLSFDKELIYHLNQNIKKSQICSHRRGSLESPTREREVVSSIPSRDRPVFKTGSGGFPLGAQDYGNSATTGPPVSG